MSNPSNLSLQLQAAVSNGIATSQTLGAAGNLTLNGSLVSGGVATFDVARRVGITSAADDSALTWTITGTDRNGNPLSETLAGANAATAQSVRDYKTVTKIAGSGATAGNVTAGTTSTASTVWVLDNPFSPYFAVRVGVYIVSGAVTYTLEHTLDDPNAGLWQGNSAGVAGPQQGAVGPGSNVPPVAWPDGVLVNQSVSGETGFTTPIFAHRRTITAGTGLALMQSLQAGIGSP